jgi:hypothetical protein
MTNTKIIIPTEHVINERQRAEDEKALYTSATAIRYEDESDDIRVVLRSGIAVSIPRHLIDELKDLPVCDLSGGLSLGIGNDVICLPKHDVDISLPGLLRDLFGFNIQRRGGLAKSEAKANASRTNGLRGGRPRTNHSSMNVA